MSVSSSRRPSASWDGTWLWKTLEKHAKAGGHAATFLPTLEIWMAKLDRTTRNRDPFPIHFNLHDPDHALRVAHRIADLIPPAIRRNLSDFELALLLLAAYGHDIGMAPELGTIQAHYRHLFALANSALSSSEKLRFQHFLRASPEGPVILPLPATLAGYNLAAELTAIHIRASLPQWSAAWLQENLHCQHFGWLPNVVEVLSRLCSGAHAGFDVLAGKDFAPFLSVVHQPAPIHLRYLACILRLADVLENDPCRIPAILFRHRDMAYINATLRHWPRDHGVTITRAEGGDANCLHLHARPRSSHGHTAVQILAAEIDRELQGIARQPFGEMRVGRKTIRRPWHLAPALTRDIVPCITTTIGHLAGGQTEA